LEAERVHLPDASADGTPADPPRFVSSIPTWSVGDPVIVGAEVRYRILDIAYDEPRDVTTWTVEPVRSGH
jgi:hypothetical protein